MKRAAGLLVTILSVGYPFFVYWGLQNYDAKILIISLVFLILLRIISSNSQNQKIIAVTSILVIVTIALGWDVTISLKFYPVVINCSLLVLFASSLIFPPTIIEQFARIQHPHLSEAGVLYTRKVTLVWIAFFALNGLAATYTAIYSSTEIWTIYNGLISYLLIATVFGVEWLYRRRVIQK